MKHSFFISISVALVLLFTACRSTPEKVQSVLKLSGNRQPELEKVIAYFKKQDDKEKLEAAYFLIGNMKDNYSYEGEAVTKYDIIMDQLDSLHRNKINLPSTSPIVKKIWDSIVTVYGPPSVSKAKKVYDYSSITADYLINHIEWAFKLRNNCPWLKKISFDNFCEFILPYRIGTEKLENWEQELDAKYKTFKDTSTAKDRVQRAADFNRIMYNWMGLDGSMRSYPFDQSVSQMHKSRRGACKHLVYYETMAMRSLGLPVGVDYCPLWGDMNRGHHWNVLLKENGKFHPFDAAGSALNGIEKYPYRLSKVFRQTYASQDGEMPGTEAPKYLLNRHCIDVTDEYIKTYNITVPVIYHLEPGKKFAVICTFTGKKWRGQDWGVIKDGKAYFKKMGANLVYIVMFYKNDEFIPATDAFILDKNGQLTYLKPSLASKQRMLLLRKYPSIPSNDTNMASMKGGCFQVARKKDFGDAITIATISKPSINIEELKISQSGRFRYVRYLNPYKQFVNVAEIEFYEKASSVDSLQKLAGKPIGYPEISAEIGYGYQKAFDSNLETFFSSKLTKPMPDTCWAGLDLMQPKKIICIRYLPRSDTNFILDGDCYELCYWDTDHWVSMGKKIAASQMVIYDNAPSNALYILHNLSRGKEERIFTYINGTQIWW
ncbi:MAG TPA: hypothetical protein VIM79_15665 [Niastella sp.]